MSAAAAEPEELDRSEIQELLEEFGKYRDKPTAFVNEVIGVAPYPFQSKMLECLAEGDSTAVRSGHGPGKTAGAAWAILWFMATHPPARVPCTAPTQHQLMDILWPEVYKWLRPSKLSAHLEWTKTKLFLRGAEPDHFAVCRSASKGEGLSGFHAPNLLYIIDEASGVEEMIMEVVDGALTEPGNIVLMISNPTRVEGRFFDAFHKLRTLWKTLHVKPGDSPRVRSGYASEMARKWGKDSDICAVRVLGDFPTRSTGAFIPIGLLEAARVRELPEKNVACVIGIDPAEFGEDMTSFVVRRGNRIIEAWERGKISQDEIVGEAAAYCRKTRVSNINIDKTGYGSGPWQALLKAQGEEGSPLSDVSILGVGFGEAADEPEDFANQAAELWGRVLTRLNDGLLDLTVLNDEAAEIIIAQGSTRKARQVGSMGHVRLEPKENLSKRGVRSPDMFDALGLACIDEGGVGDDLWSGGTREAGGADDDSQATADVWSGGERVSNSFDW